MAWLYALLFCSGALALIYEVLWMRRFAAIFGATAPAAAAVLSAIFLGLALGSALGGWLSARSSKPLRIYGLLEIGIGAGALLVEPILRLYDSWYPALYQRLDASPELFVAVKFALTMGAVLLPSMWMGATIPVLTPAITATSAGLGTKLGGFYAINVFGAAAGALSVPYLLLPYAGAELGVWLAASANGALGVIAIALGTRVAPRADRAVARAPPAAKAAASATAAAPQASAAGAWLLTGAFLSGLVLLGLEVLWTRMFSLVHENSIYSFALVLAIFLTGLAAGAALAGRLLRAGRSPRAILSTSWLVSGVLIAASPLLFLKWTSGMSYLGGEASLVGAGFLLPCLAVALPATIAAGMALPALLELAGARNSRAAAGPTLARLFASNTLGSLLGPPLATFLLGPSLGLWRSIIASGAALLAAGALVAPLSIRRGVLVRVVIALALPAGAWLLAPDSVPVRWRSDREHIVCLREGAHGVVAVLEDSSDRWITANNHYIIGGSAAAYEERQQGLIPLLLHPAPRSVVFLGLGTGITASAAVPLAVDHAVVVELIPEVVHAAVDHFADANLGIGSDPHVKIVVDDARNYLKASGERFDVIVGDLFVPWRSGEAALLTEEHFQCARAALRENGIYCQWFPLFQMTREEFEIAATTFIDVFPSATIWRGDFFADRPALALIGHADDKPLDPASIDVRVRALARHGTAGRFLSEPAGLWMFLAGDAECALPLFTTSRRNRDATPWLEVLTPRSGNAGERAGFTGNALGDFFTLLCSAPPRGPVLREMDAEHLAWRDAGLGFWRAACLEMDGRSEDAHRTAVAALARVPETLKKSLLAEGAQGE